MKSYFKSPVCSIGFGIDFGTSNSAAAMFDGNKVSMIDLSEQVFMPSATYIDKDFINYTGDEAIARLVPRMNLILRKSSDMRSMILVCPGDFLGEQNDCWAMLLMRG